MYAGIHFTDPERIESWVNFSGKEGQPNIQPLTRPGIEPGTASGLGGKDLTTAPTPPLFTYNYLLTYVPTNLFIYLFIYLVSYLVSYLATHILSDLGADYMSPVDRAGIGPGWPAQLSCNNEVESFWCAKQAHRDFGKPGWPGLM